MPEKLFPLPEAVELATGRRPHLSTVLRWATSLNRFGNRLETTVVGGRRLTSVDAVVRFNEANTRAADPLVANRSPTAQLIKAHDSAVQELKDEGLQGDDAALGTSPRAASALGG